MLLLFVVLSSLLLSFKVFLLSFILLLVFVDSCNWISVPFFYRLIVSEFGKFKSDAIRRMTHVLFLSRCIFLFVLFFFSFSVLGVCVELSLVFLVE